MGQDWRVSVALKKNSEAVLLALPAERKLLLMVLLTGIEKRAFDRPVAAYQVAGDVLICSNNKTTSGRAAAMKLPPD